MLAMPSSHDETAGHSHDHDALRTVRSHDDVPEARIEPADPADFRSVYRDPMPFVPEAVREDVLALCDALDEARAEIRSWEAMRGQWTGYLVSDWNPTDDELRDIADGPIHDYRDRRLADLARLVLREREKAGHRRKRNEELLAANSALSQRAEQAEANETLYRRTADDRLAQAMRLGEAVDVLKAERDQLREQYEPLIRRPEHDMEDDYRGELERELVQARAALARAENREATLRQQLDTQMRLRREEGAWKHRALNAELTAITAKDALARVESALNLGDLAEVLAGAWDEGWRPATDSAPSGTVFEDHPNPYRAAIAGDPPAAVRTKPYLRDRRAGDPCDFGDCEDNTALLRVNPKGEAGIFMCEQHARISHMHQRPAALGPHGFRRDMAAVRLGLNDLADYCTSPDDDDRSCGQSADHPVHAIAEDPPAAETCRVGHDLYGTCELPCRHEGPHSRVPGGATEPNRWTGTSCLCRPCRETYGPAVTVARVKS